MVILTMWFLYWILEGFWRQGERHPVDDRLRTGRAGGREGAAGIDYTRKEDFQWISVIRVPDFVTEKDFEWAIAEAPVKKKQDFSKVEFLTYEEGLCVQCMHIGAYDAEPVTVKKMTAHAILMKETSAFQAEVSFSYTAGKRFSEFVGNRGHIQAISSADYIAREYNDIDWEL